MSSPLRTPGKVSKRRGSGSLGPKLQSAAGTLATASPKRVGPGKRRKSRKKSLEPAAESGASSLTKDEVARIAQMRMEEEEKQFREGAVMNSIGMPKKVKTRRKSSMKEVSKVEEQKTQEIAPAEEFDDDEYQDDQFEEYEEDFEDYNESEEVTEKDEAGKEMKISNKTLKSTSQNQFAPALKPTTGEEKLEKSETRTERPRKRDPQVTRTKIQKPDFRSQMQNLSLTASEIGVSTTSHAAKRAKKIRLIVELSECRIDVFEQFSQHPWDFYLQSVGAGGTRRQAQTQTNEDALEASIQTEPIECRTVSCQDDVVDVQNGESKETDLEIPHFRGIDSLTDLLCAIAQENSAHCLITAQSKLSCRASEPVLETRVIKTAHPNLAMENRSAVDVHFSNTQPDVLLCAFGPCSIADALHCGIESKDEARRLSASSVLCFYDFRKSRAKPIWHLVCAGTVSRCVLNPGVPCVAIAAMGDGTIVAWDLRGISQMQNEPIRPTYVGPANSDPAEQHVEEIRDLQLVSQTPVSWTSLGFQIASLDRAGSIQLWAILHQDPTTLVLDENSDLIRVNTSNEDPCVAVNGKLRLHHVEKIDLLPDEFCEACVLAVHPHDSSQIFVGLTSGEIVRCSRFGQLLRPRRYKPPPASQVSEFPEMGVEISALSLNMELDDFFVAGFANGTLALYNLAHTYPLKTWRREASSLSRSQLQNVAVSQAIWNPSNGCSISVLNDNGEMQMWNFKQDSLKPLFSMSLTENKEVDGGPPFSKRFSISRSHVRAAPLEFAAISDRKAIKVYTLNPTFAQFKDAAQEEVDEENLWNEEEEFLKTKNRSQKFMLQL